MGTKLVAHDCHYIGPQTGWPHTAFPPPSPFLFHISQDLGMAIFFSEWSSTCKNILGFWQRSPTLPTSVSFSLANILIISTWKIKRIFVQKIAPNSPDFGKKNKMCITRFLQQIPAGSQTIKEFCNFFTFISDL
jgi:hypothetical protein